MPLFTVLSFRTPKSAENLNIFSEKAHSVCSTSDCCVYVRPLKNTTTYLSMCGRGNEVTQGKVTWCAGCCQKMRLFSGLFWKNIRYFAECQILQQCQTIGENILQISCKTLLKKKREYRCVVQMHGSENARRFRWFWSDAVVFRLFKVFSSSLQHIRRTYRANIRDQLIKNTAIVSVDVILSV